MSRFKGRLHWYIAAAATSLLYVHVAMAGEPALPPVQRVNPALPGPSTSQDLTADASAFGSSADASPSSDLRSAVLADAAVAPMPADPRQIECVAKVVHHEAANQPLRGQVAVAQVIRARMKDGRFPRTACGVVKQRGQFFDVDAYDPPRTDSRWAVAMQVAAEALQGKGDEVAGGALFFHADGRAMANRVQVAKIADHVFYR